MESLGYTVILDTIFLAIWQFKRYLYVDRTVRNIICILSLNTKNIE